MKTTQTMVATAVLLLSASCADIEDGELESNNSSEATLDVSTQALTVANFNGWQSIPAGTASSGPAASSRGSNLDVYIRGGDNQFWYNYWSDFTGWLGYSPIGGIFTSKPSTTSFQGSIAVTGKGTDNKVWIQVWQPPGGSGHPVGGGWQSIPGGPFVGAPAIAFHQGSNTLFAFARKSAGFCPTLLADTLLAPAPAPAPALAASLSTATQLESSATLAIGASQLADAREHLALDSALAIDSSRIVRINCTHAIYVAKNQLTVNASGQLIYNHASWGAWSALSGLNASSDPAAVEAGGKMVVVARGPGNSYYLASTYGSSWSSWSSIPGGVFSSAPALTAYGYGDLHVIGRGMDNRYWGATRDYDVWSGWDPIGSQTFDSPPGAASLADGHFFVLGTIASGVVRANEYED